MKKAEAISILATSVRPREAKDRARYDEAVKMAIKALKSSERTAEASQTDHIADSDKKVERDDESAQNVKDGDLIFRQAAIDAIERNAYRHTYIDQIVDIIKDLPSVQPEKRTEERTKTHACDLIDRQSAIDAVNTALFPKINTAKDAEKALRALPSAQPELRREEKS